MKATERAFAEVRGQGEGLRQQGCATAACSGDGAQKVAWSTKIRQPLPRPSHFDVYSEWRKALKAGLPALAKEAVASKPGSHENDSDIRLMDEAHIGQKGGRNKLGRSAGSGDAFCATAATVVFAVSPLPLRCAAQASPSTSKSRRTLRQMPRSCRNPSRPRRQLLASTINQRMRLPWMALIDPLHSWVKIDSATRSRDQSDLSTS